MSGRRQSFGVLGVGTVSVSDAQDVDTAAGGMAFDRLIVHLSAGIAFSRSIKHVMYVSLLIQCRSQGSATTFGISLLLHTTRTCTCTYMPSPRAQLLIKSLSGVD